MTQHFTVEQANALIPTLEDLVQRLQDQETLMSSEYAEIEGLRERVRTNGGHALGGPYLGEMARFAKLIEELHDHGCLLKDITKGLLDFPALKDGREVYLCWMLGEESVEWWHERETGFAGRQPIETL
ncbi:MAG: DUF2203 domain-containing protein [Nitrospinae bacterium]|nr:DUF2203 domain-containing protein [Nitrospinota bacterium]